MLLHGRQEIADTRLLIHERGSLSRIQSALRSATSSSRRRAESREQPVKVLHTGNFVGLCPSEVEDQVKTTANDEG
jgi:hypothetical protein